MSRNCKFKYLILPLVIILSSCDSTEESKKVPFETKAEYEQTMIESHKAFLKKEKKKIQEFIDESGLNFQRSGTGLRYHIYENSDGDSLKEGELAIITYLLTSIEGDTLYESPREGAQEFLVDYDNVESGLHEGIKFMKLGEKGIFILPAHLAHGITGDQAAIPSQTTLVYNVHLLDKR